MDKTNHKTGEEMIVDLVNMFLPQFSISDKAKNNCKNAIDEMVLNNQAKEIGIKRRKAQEVEYK